MPPFIFGSEWELSQANDCPNSPSSASDTSDTSDAMKSIIDSLFDIVSDGGTNTSACSSNDVWVDSVLHGEYTGDSEDEDLEDYDTVCYNCDDCHAKRHARDERVQRTLGFPSRTDFDDTVIPAHYTERNTSQYPTAKQPNHPAPIGQRPYKLWPLPIGEGRPSRNPFQGQRTTTHNVIKPTTYPIRGPTDEDVFIHFEKTLQENWGEFYQARDVPRLWTIQSLPAQR
ncbi:hypothetical protein QCA50_011527 [Cerrena zonata]|uniref:Uncharacterized protein n=1 Tax=Cerrena zonata TaxID=2478898 RepID=A0AAW0G489_9APHY